MKKTHILVAMLGIAVAFTNCKKEKEAEPAPTPVTTPPPAAGAAKSFTNVTFNATNQWFSTAGTSSSTKDSAAAKLAASTLDLGYTYDFGYDEPGFLDLVTRSNGSYYWSSTFYTPWTSVSKKVLWYETSFSNFAGTEFTAAKSNQTKIGQYFSDTSKVFLADGHPIWPDGACIGGRNAVATLAQYKVFAFKRVADGKRGLMKINSLPTWGLNTDTKVDIIIEN
jgi:hypothetical protein